MYTLTLFWATQGAVYNAPFYFFHTTTLESGLDLQLPNSTTH